VTACVPACECAKHRHPGPTPEHRGNRRIEWTRRDARVSVTMRLTRADADLLRSIAAQRGRFVQNQLERIVSAYLNRYREEQG
jgi:hypothetical protein